mgnify:CR=1 FL=1
MISLDLNKNLIEEFNNNGFLISDKFIEPKYLDKLRDRFMPLFNGDFETGIEPDEFNWKFGRDPENVTRQICNAWKSDKLIKNFVCHKIIGRCCSFLMNWKGAKLLQDNVLWKPPGGSAMRLPIAISLRHWLIFQSSYGGPPRLQMRKVIRRAVQCCLHSLETLHEFQILEMITPKANELYHSS